MDILKKKLNGVWTYSAETPAGRAMFRHCAGADTCSEAEWPAVQELLFAHDVAAISTTIEDHDD